MILLKKSNIMTSSRLFEFALNLYKNKNNTLSKCESSNLYPDAEPVSEALTVPFPTVNIIPARFGWSEA
jgi:hypothetical protein